jgi:hypothetical protein
LRTGRKKKVNKEHEYQVEKIQEHHGANYKQALHPPGAIERQLISHHKTLAAKAFKNYSQPQFSDPDTDCRHSHPCGAFDVSG